MENWKKVESENGFLYYVNEALNVQQWDHPKFSYIKRAIIDDCNYIVYSPYRFASKLLVLQRYLCMDQVPLSIAATTFKSHSLGNNENSLVLETYDLEIIISDVFFAVNKQNSISIDVDLATQIVINLLYNIFDSSREGKVEVSAMKITLGILCYCSMRELHEYLFSICMDHNNCITRLKLKGLLEKIHAIIKYLNEEAFFELNLLNLAVEDCFKDSPGLVGMDASNFVNWLSTDVAFLSWMPLMWKLKASETVIHSEKCTSCKAKPISGLKYRCTKCIKYIQCQNCFLTGTTTRSHKLTHSMREYSAISLSNVLSSNGFWRKISVLFCNRDVERNHSIIKPYRQFANEIAKRPLREEDLLTSSSEDQLQGVIKQLETQNRELQRVLAFGKCGGKEMREYLEEYRLFMAKNIQKLKLLMTQINIATPTDCQPNNIQVMPQKYHHGSETSSNRSMSPITLTTEIDDSIYKSKTTNYKNCVWNKASRASTPLSTAPIAEPPKSPAKLLNNFDEALARLQQILANNFSLDDSITSTNNTNLKSAVTEVEDMLTSIIDNVESSRCNSVLADFSVSCRGGPTARNNRQILKVIARFRPNQQIEMT